LLNAFEKSGAQVSFTGIGQYYDYCLAGVLRTLGNPRGDCDRGSARNAGQNSFLASEALRVMDRVFVGDLFDYIDERKVQVSRNEARAYSLYLVRTGLQRLAAALLRDDGTRGRLDGDRDDRFALGRFDVARNAGDRAAGADACHENIDGAVGVVPDFRPCRRFVDGGIRGVAELLQQDIAVGRGRLDFLGLRDRTAHAARAFSQHQFRAVSDQQFAALEAHRIRHRQRQRNVAGRGDEGERDSGVTAGRFNQFLARTKQAALFGVPDHRGADSAFNGVRRVASFDLAEDRRRRAVGDAVEPHQRRVADRSRIVVVPVWHLISPDPQIVDLYYPSN